MKDDEVDTTLDWLLASGLRCRSGFGVIVTPLLSLWDSSGGWGLYFHNGDGDAFTTHDDATGAVRIASAGTREDVRRILAVFGSERQEPAKPSSKQLVAAMTDEQVLAWFEPGELDELCPKGWSIYTARRQLASDFEGGFKTYAE